MSTFEVVHGPEGDCLLLDDTRICGPKPWGGGAVTKTFHTDKAYAVVPKAENDRLKAENAKLREELAKARDPQRIGGRADPSSFVYAIEQLKEFRWQHATNDEDAIPYINNVAAAHERENDKLRELLRQAIACIRQGEDEYGSDWSCAGCEFCDTCDGLIQMRATAQELGVTDA